MYNKINQIENDIRNILKELNRSRQLFVNKQDIDIFRRKISSYLYDSFIKNEIYYKLHCDVSEGNDPTEVVYTLLTDNYEKIETYEDLDYYLKFGCLPRK